MNDLFAMLKQLGLPTWFATFSSAELSRWPETVEANLKQQGISTKFENLTFKRNAMQLNQTQ